jgi:hypothetical protein
MEEGRFLTSQKSQKIFLSLKILRHKEKHHIPKIQNPSQQQEMEVSKIQFWG